MQRVVVAVVTDAVVVVVAVDVAHRPAGNLRFSFVSFSLRTMS